MSDKNLTDVIDSKNFKRRMPSPRAILINDTSQQEILDWRIIKIIEFKKAGCIFKIPQKKCAIGHNLTIYFLTENSPQKIQKIPKGGDIEGAIRVSTKVISQDNIEEASFVECEFSQYSQPEWEAYLNKINQSQNKIFDDFKKVKAG
ncbi:MAG: hypothetical protein HOE90_01725 [Bacteriovoracaceae bacterium]|jgi:hypothetical protein|nr:hypothetical protein [Bacteriovoracaceae bacterium]